jgi:hypothetical protein
MIGPNVLGPIGSLSLASATIRIERLQDKKQLLSGDSYKTKASLPINRDSGTVPIPKGVARLIYLFVEGRRIEVYLEIASTSWEDNKFGLVGLKALHICLETLKGAVLPAVIH